MTDGRVSRFWLAKAPEQLNLTLWPEEFYQEFFHDRVTDGDRNALDTLKAVVRRLEAEFVGEHLVQ
jgi:hypothetical protein